MKKKTIYILIGTAAVGTAAFLYMRERKKAEVAKASVLNQIIATPSLTKQTFPSDLTSLHRDQLETLWLTATETQRTLISAELTRRGYQVTRSRTDPTYLSIMRIPEKSTTIQPDKLTTPIIEPVTKVYPTIQPVTSYIAKDYYLQQREAALAGLFF